MRTNTHFLIISRSFLLRTRNTSERICRETKHTFYVPLIFFFPKTLLYDILWKNNVQPDRPHCIACWIPKATSTHSDYVILIAFSLQQWLQERALILRYNILSVLCTVNKHDFTSSSKFAMHFLFGYLRE